MQNKKKLILPAIGALAGVLFSLWDTFISYGDAAPFDEPVKTAFIHVVSSEAFIFHALIYGFAGGVTVFLACLILAVCRKKMKTS